MKTFVIALIIAAALAVGAFLALRPSEPPTYAQIQAAQLAADQAAQLAPVWTIAQAIVIVGVPVLILGFATAWGYVALARFHNERKADARGRLPVLRSDASGYQLAAMAALEQYHATEHQRAQIAPVPTSYAPHYSTSYAPHTAHSGGSPAQITGTASAVLDMPVPMLPDVATLAEYLPQIKPHCLAFGIDTSGRLLQAPLSQSYHLLSSGRTRSGKSNSLNLILAQLHYQQRMHGLRASISVLDYKRELSAIWSRSALVELATTEPGDMVDLLHALVHGADGLLARQDLFAREGQRRGRVFGNLAEYERGTGETLHRHYIAIDELNAVLIAADNKHLGDELAQLLYLGAGAGFFVIGGAHQLDAATFKRAAKEQFSTRIQFGPFDQSAVNLMFGSIKVQDSDVQLLDGRGGRGLVQLVSQARPTPFQALQVEEADLLPYIDQQPDAETAATMRLLDDQAATIAAQSFASDAPIASHTRRAIWQKKHAGINKEQTILHLWSIPKNGRGPYRQAAALYDRVIALGPPDSQQAG